MGLLLKTELEHGDGKGDARRAGWSQLVLVATLEGRAGRSHRVCTGAAHLSLDGTAKHADSMPPNFLRPAPAKLVVRARIRGHRNIRRRGRTAARPFLTLS